MGKATETPSKIFKGFGPGPSCVRAQPAQDNLARKAAKARSKPAAKRNGTAAGKRYMGRVAALPCVLCELIGQAQQGKTDVHHLREDVGAGQRNSDFLTAALCHEACHQGPQGIHGDRSRLRLAGVTELDLLALTIAKLQEAA